MKESMAGSRAHPALGKNRGATHTRRPGGYPCRPRNGDGSVEPSRSGRRGLATRLRLEILPQPNETTCGPTSLHAVYRYYNDEVPLTSVIEEIKELEDGGTLAVMLAIHALNRGYTAKLYTYNLHIFDPTWFDGEDARPNLAERLLRQSEIKTNAKLLRATESYLEYLALGGQLRFRDLNADLIRRHLKVGRPILTGLSATYLYHCAREIPETNQYDDVVGQPAGHFVVLAGYNKMTRQVLIADPLGDNPTFEPHLYEVDIDRLVGAILLGVLTYDANLLIVEPKKVKSGKN